MYKHTQGQSLVELLVTIAVAAVMLPAVMSGFVITRQGKIQQQARFGATMLLAETQDAVRIIRNRDWNTFAINGIFHPVVSSNKWILTDGSDTVQAYTRSVSISDVSRNTNGDIVSSGGSVDPSTKKIVTTISWNTLFSTHISSTEYVTRHDYNTYTQTLKSDFDPGVFYNTATTNVSGGEVALGNNNRAKWCTPALSTTTIDLPDGPPVAVAATAAASINTPNDVFVATAPNTTSSIKMAYVNVTANTDTPTASLRGIFTLDPAQYSGSGYVPTNIGLDNTFKTNDIKFYKSASGKTYALMTTNLPDREVIVVQVNDGAGDSFQDPINKIYKYWSYFNTKIYDTAFTNPTAHSAETTNAGDNNGFQTNPTNAYLNDGQFAVDTNSGNNTGTNCTGTDKDKHRFYNYGFSVPTGATINGIEVSLVAKVDSTTGAPKICVQLSWDGGATWTAAKSTSTLSTNAAPYTVGGSTDTWGRTWTNTNFSNANFRMRIIDVASNNSRDFSLDYAGVKVYYNGIASLPNDQEPFGYGAKGLTILGNRGYVASGGYLYTFDLSTIDTKSPTNSLDQVGCRIELDGYDCSPGTGTDKKYAAGEYGTSWSDTTSPAHNDCSDGGNVELYADNDLYGVQSGGSNYIYIAVGAGTNPEFEIVNATSVPDSGSTPSISSSSCGRISGGNAAWKVTGSLDFNSNSGTEEAANSVYAKSDGLRAYISSNGGIDANHDGTPDSDQLYIIDTSNKSSPKFLSGSSSTGAQSGYYYGSGANAQLYPRRSLTVLNGQRAVLVGKDGVSDANNAQEYQVLHIDNETTPNYCGGIDFDQGFNDLTSVSEADGDNFVYMVANTTEKQLKIIEGGPDTGLYLTPGTFESDPFLATGSAAFNYISATVSQPANTNIKLQVASSAIVSGSCTDAAYTYVGPDGTDTTYFTPTGTAIGNTIPFGTIGGYQNPNQCFRYKVYLDTTDTNQTPVLQDVTVKYSP
jgi:type II secretory pathway pseudopilin PulG